MFQGKDIPYVLPLVVDRIIYYLLTTDLLLHIDINVIRLTQAAIRAVAGREK